MAEIIVTVADTQAPVIGSFELPITCIWPPNHKYVALPAGSASLHVVDACSPVVTEYTVVSSESDNTSGDGDTTNDAVVEESGICLRAERQGSGSGRVYTVTVTATDISGNASTAEDTVVVRHNGVDRGCVTAEFTSCPFER